MSLVLCFTAEKPGQHASGRKTTWKASSAAVSDGSSASHGETKLPTLLCWSKYTLLCQRRLQWLGYVHRMNDDCIPKDIVYGELDTLRSKNVCKRYLKLGGIDSGKWEQLADDCSGWCHAVQGRDTKVRKRQNQLLVIRIPRTNKTYHSTFICYTLQKSAMQRLVCSANAKRC